MALDYSSAWGDPLKSAAIGTDYVNSLYDRAFANRARQAKLDAGQAYARGDYTGSANALFNAGDIAGGQGVQDIAAKQFQARHALLQQAVPVLSGIYQKGGQKALSDAFEQFAPTLQQSGLDEATINSVRQGLQTNPEQTLQVLNIGAKKSTTYQKLANGQILALDDAGNIVQTFGNPETKVVTPGGTLVQDAPFVTGGGAPSPAAGGLQAAAPSQTPATGAAASPPFGTNAPAMPPPGYAARVAMNESGGNPGATNPSSSATGSGQFIASTWLNLIRQSHPELASMSDEALLALRNNPALSNDMIEQYAAINGRALNQAGLPVNAATLYLAHGFGSDGAIRLLKSDPNAPVTTVMPAQVIAANPYLKNMSVGQLLQRFATKMGGAEPGAIPASSASPPPTNGARVLFTAPPAKDWQALSDDERKLYPGAVQINRETGEVKYPPQGAMTGDAATVDYAARRYLAGDMSAITGRGTAFKLSVIKRATEISHDLGSSPEGDAARLNLRQANAAALTQNTRLGAFVAQAELTASKNADLVLSLAPRGVGPSKAPLVNSWIQAGRKALAGNSDLASFDTAIRTFANEYARVMSGGTGNQQLTDAARNEMNDLLSRDQNIDAIRATIATMKKDMANRKSGIQEEHDALVEALGGAPAQATAAAPSRGATPPANDGWGQVRVH